MQLLEEFRQKLLKVGRNEKMNVLMIGVDETSIGGMLTVVNNYKNNKEFCKMTNLKYVATVIRSNKLVKIKTFLCKIPEIISTIRNDKIDIVHVHMAERGSVFREGFVVLLANVMGCKTVIHMHGADIEDWYNKQFVLIKKLIANIFCAADVMIVLGDNWLPFMRSVMVGHEEKIKVLHNAVYVEAENKAMARMNKNNLRIATAIIVSGLGVFISYLINFLLTPYITDNIGIEAYGFVSLAKNFVNYAQIATIAITSFVVRYISVSYHERKMQEANEYYSTSVIACVALAGVIFISALLLITKIDLLLNVPQNLVFSVKLLFLIVFLNFVLTTATTPFTTAAYIKNRLDITGIIKIIAYLVDAGVMVILFINCTPNVWFVGMGSLAASVVTFICTYILSKKLVPELVFNKDSFSVSKLKNLVGNGIWNSLNSLGNELNSGLDLIISNLFLNGVATGQIAVMCNMDEKLFLIKKITKRK